MSNYKEADDVELWWALRQLDPSNGYIKWPHVLTFSTQAFLRAVTAWRCLEKLLDDAAYKALRAVSRRHWQAVSTS